MKKNFFTGLGIILPLVFTILILRFLINLLTAPFLGIAHWFLSHFALMQSEQTEFFLSRLLILLVLLLFTFLIGLLGKSVITHSLIKIGDQIFHQIPIINRVYKGIQEVVHTVFKEEEGKSLKFSRVVIVPFPFKESKAIGFLLNDHLPDSSDDAFKHMVSVFVPATPNPTMGFNLLYKREELIYSDMGVEEALKGIVSCGVMLNSSEVAL